MKFTFLGHAAGYLETGSDRFLFDPFLTGNPKATVTADQLNPTYILLTHGHGDHVGDSVAISKRTGAPIVTTYELANWLGAQGAATVAMNHGGWGQFPFGRVRFTIAFHSSSTIEEGGRPLYLGEPAGVVLQTEGKVIYHAGDTALFFGHAFNRGRRPHRFGITAHRRAFHHGTKRRRQGGGVFGAETRRADSLWNLSVADW
jgi:L-ascorbate metabolism protein UlaG (beta-lactamase superfamily)